MLVCPYTPQHSGIIERVRQWLMSATDTKYGRCVARDGCMPDGYYHTYAPLRSASAHGVLSNEVHLSSVVDPVHLDPILLKSTPLE